MANSRLSTMKELAVEHLDRYGVISAPIVQHINSNGSAKPSMEECNEVVKELVQDDRVVERQYSFVYDKKK